MPDLRASAEDQPDRGLRLALAGGGTGGHITPGLRLVRQLAAQQRLASVLWLAGDRRVDHRLLGDLPDVMRPVPARLLSLGIEGGRDRAPGRTLQLRRMPAAVARAARALRESGAELLVGLGGYTSLPAVLAARSLGLPVVLVEVNAVLGGATRLLAPFAQRVCHAFPASMPTGAAGRSGKHIISGPLVAPRGEAGHAAGRRAADGLLREHGLEPGRPVLLVLGGSQGAGALNRFVSEQLDALLSTGAQVLHQVGPGRIAEAAAGRERYAAFEFLDPVEPALEAADLVLARSGAATLAELAGFGLPSVLVPYPHAADDHQRLNAEQLGAAAVMLPESSLDPERALQIARLVGREGREQRKRMSNELVRRVPLDGARRVADTCLELVGLRALLDDLGPRSEAGDGALPAGLPRRVHLLGVGGAGQSGLARLLVARGAFPSGHDRSPSATLEELRGEGLAIRVGASDAAHLPADAELVVRSAAVPLDDPQVVEARRRGLPVLKYAEALGRTAPEGRTLAIAGTHGKTSTSWLAWHALAGGLVAAGEAGRPGALIGGRCLVRQTNAIPASAAGPFVVEACEYDRSFLQLAPRVAVITNVEADHLDCFGDIDGVIAAFEAFAARVDPHGALVLGPDVPESIELAARCRVLRPGRDFRVEVEAAERGLYAFELELPDGTRSRAQLGVPGRFQVDNASLALVAATLIGEGLDVAAAAAGVGAYRGAGRRFERWLAEGPVEVVHDYAHHPTEVRVTLEAAREAFGELPLHVLFQPHQFERTARFMDEFAASFERAGRVVVADVYGARRAAQAAPEADAVQLVERLRGAGVDALEGGSLSSCVERLLEGLTIPAAILVIGAGDVETIRDDLVARLALRCGSPS